MTTNYDPFASAVEAGERPDQYYGEIALHVQFVNLAKGQKKELFDEQTHDVRNRRTEVEITILPLAESGLVNPIQRSVIAESAEWSKIVWPSLRALGVQDGNAMRALHGKFAAIEFAKTGRTYTSNKTGETMESTTIKFVGLYDTEAACTAAWKGAFGSASAQQTNGNGNGAHANGNGAHGPANGTANGTANAAERATMAAFLPALVKQAGGNADKLAEIIAANPMISKHFTVDSPEVLAVLTPM